jgi:hypothetical protein
MGTWKFRISPGTALNPVEDARVVVDCPLVLSTVTPSVSATKSIVLTFGSIVIVEVPTIFCEGIHAMMP